MPANGAIYIQEARVDLGDVFDGVSSDGGSFDRATYYDVKLGGDVVRFNVLPREELDEHIRGFLGYIDSLDQDARRKQDAAYVIGHTKVVLGLVTDVEFEDNHEIWQSLFRIADFYHGYVFVYGSVLLPNGAVIVGPLLDPA